ncbi:MAG: DsbA family protein [Rickettsiales bacterium]|jgi:protein-disulfide isomerase|nr:DsbA family protein [Rickettsiales bacterium]
MKDELSIVEEVKNSPITIKISHVLVVVSLILSSVALCYSIGASKNGVNNDGISRWIAENPEAILDSVNNYARKMQEEQQAQQQVNAVENIKNMKKELENTKNQGVIGKGKKVIVEFFDYDCPYCRMAAKNTKELVKNRKDVKVILKPLVIHDSAQLATEIGIAIAITAPEKFEAYYDAIMIDGQGQSGGLVKDAVSKAGLKYERIEEALNKKRSEVNAVISEIREQASVLGVNGTPAFVFTENSQIIPGAVDANTLSITLDK